MVLAQSAATAASVAIDSKTSVQSADVEKIQGMLVANPLADNSTPEILVDNDDAQHVTVNGDWNKETRGSYGPSMFTDHSKGVAEKSVRFSPEIKKSGRYHIYTYVPRLPGHATVTPVKVNDGRSTKAVKIMSETVKVEGQTSGEWVDLGTYQLKAGTGAYVEIGNTKADGAVVADAVLFIAE